MLYSTALPKNSGSASVHSDVLPDCPENYGSALLCSRTLTENSVSVLLCSSALTDSPPGFPASNLESKNKALVPCTGFSSAIKIGQNRGSDQYRGVFERIWVNVEKDQAYWEDWDKAALRRIIQQQRKHGDVQEVGDEESWTILRTCSSVQPCGSTSNSFAAGGCATSTSWTPW